MVFVRALTLLASATTASGHAFMIQPESRQKGALNVSGCANGPPDAHDPSDPAWLACTVNHVAWFCGAELAPAQCDSLPGPSRTIPVEMLSSPADFKSNFPGDITPWEAPGSVMPASPCGSGRGLNPIGVTDGRNLPKTAPMENWMAGSIQQVGWSMWANHGGGYAWRLCPASDDINEITEECFRKTPLEFSDDYSIVEWINKTQVRIPAKTTSEGTIPKGSQWRRNPIPSTEFLPYGAYTCPPGWQQGTAYCPAFEPPCPNCWGAQSPDIAAHIQHAHQDYSILDNIKVPSNLATGDYVLQFRWDIQLITKQVWTNCADVHVSASRSTMLV